MARRRSSPAVEEGADVVAVVPDVPEVVEASPAPVLSVADELRGILDSCQVNSEVISRLSALIDRIEA